jgi:colanic acid/amylovoran biosynthesis protein
LRVVVLNTVLSNSGDAAIYQAIVEALVAAGVAASNEVIALDSSAIDTRVLYPHWKILQQPSRSPSRSKWRRRFSNRMRESLTRLLTTMPAARSLVLRGPFARGDFALGIRAIQEADLVLSSGGTYLVDHYNFSHRVREIQFADAMGKPIYLWTQSAGPFKASKAAALIQQLTPSVEGVFFRDQRSLAAWASASDLPAIHSVAPDCVFGIYSAQSSAVVTDGRVPPIALLSVREWSQGAEGGALDFAGYRSAMRAVARNLLERGWQCVAVSTCQGVDGYSVDDARTAKSIFDGLDVTIDGEFHTPDQLIQLIQSAGLVVSTRMHLAILSLISRTPVIAIAYEPKSLELFRSLGHGSSVIEIERTSVAWADQLFEGSDVRDQAALLSPSELENLRERATEPARIVAAQVVALAG